MADKKFTVDIGFDKTGLSEGVNYVKDEFAKMNSQVTEMQAKMSTKLEKAGMQGIVTNPYKNATQQDLRAFEDSTKMQAQAYMKTTQNYEEQAKKVKSINEQILNIDKARNDNQKKYSDQTKSKTNEIEETQKKLAAIPDDARKSTSEVKREKELLELLAKHKSELQEIQKIEENSLKTSEKEKKLKQEQLETVEAIQAKDFKSLNEQSAAIDKNLKQSELMKQNMPGAPGGAGGPGGGGGERLESTLSNIAFMAPILKGIAVVQEHMATMPARTEAAKGSAIQSTVGEALKQVYSGRSAFESIFADQNKKAADIAEKTAADTRDSDVTSLMAAAATAVASALPGAAAGAAVGSVIPGLGTAIGGFIGGATAAGGAMFGMTNERQRNLGLSAIPGTGGGEAYEAGIEQLKGSTYAQTKESLRQQHPELRAASDEYEQNMQRNLAAQRATGLGFGTFHGAGGFRDVVSQSGFTTEAGLGASQRILGAGGSTGAAGAAGSALALRAERNLNLTNAPELLGRVSGGMGMGIGKESDMASKQALEKVIASGMSIGLDSSKFAEESRHYAELAAAAVATSGVDVSKQGQEERVLHTLESFMTDKSQLGIEAGKKAYDVYQGISSATTGRQGVMQFTGMMSSPIFSKLSGRDMAALAQIPENQFTESNDIVRSLAAKAKVSPGALIDEKTKVNLKSMSSFEEFDQAAKRMKDFRQKQLATKDHPEGRKLTAEDVSGFTADKNSKQLQDIGTMEKDLAIEYGIKDPRELRSLALKKINDEKFDLGKAAKEQKEAEAKIEQAGPTGKIEDITMKQLAADSSLVSDKFRELAVQIAAMTGAAVDFRTKVAETVKTPGASTFLEKMGTQRGHQTQASPGYFGMSKSTPSVPEI